MTDTIGHIICGGAGDLIAEKTIIIKDHTVLNAAINLKHEGLIAHYVEVQGMTPEQAHKKALRVGRRIQRFWNDLYEDFEEDGIPAYAYDVNPANFSG